MSERGDVLHEAATLVDGDRNDQYGPPAEDFARTAQMLTALGFSGPGGGAVKAWQVGVIMSCVKLSRIAETPSKRDSWVDLAGYAGCGWECVADGPAADW